jgi:hypothetical protein
MQTKFKIVETPEYYLAVSEEEIKKGDSGLITSAVMTYEQMIKEWGEPLGSKIIAHQPKNNAPDLDLPLLPEMVVEDSVQSFIEPILKKKGDENNRIDLDAYALGLIDGYKAAYSEDDLRKAIKMAVKGMYDSPTKGWTTITEDEIIQSLKQPKPKWFVAEIEYYYHSSKELYSDADFVKCTKEQYESIKSEIPTCPLKTKLKITTKNGKTYLVGTYLYE